jgi:fluoride ion exporter CrcB/FEX
MFGTGSMPGGYAHLKRPIEPCTHTTMMGNTELPLGCVGGLTTFSVFHSSSHFTTRTSPRKSVLLKRLQKPSELQSA